MGSYPNHVSSSLAPATTFSLRRTQQGTIIAGSLMVLLHCMASPCHRCEKDCRRRLERIAEDAYGMEDGVPSSGRLLAQKESERRRACVASCSERHMVRRMQEWIPGVSGREWLCHSRRRNQIQRSIHLLDILRLMQQSYSTGQLVITEQNEPCFHGPLPQLAEGMVSDAIQ